GGETIDSFVNAVEAPVQGLETRVHSIAGSIEPLIDGIEPLVDVILESIEPFVDSIELAIYNGLKQGQFLPNRRSFRRQSFDISAKLLHLRRNHILNRLFQVLINV